MKSCYIVSTAVAILSGPICFAGTVALQSTNSWIDGTGKWETPGNWSAGAPVFTNVVNLITNAASKTVTIDALTPSGNLTVNKLVMFGPSGTLNTLQVTNTPGLPFQLFTSLEVSNGAALMIMNSTMIVDGGGDILDGGTVTLMGGTLIATNVFIGIGEPGNGQMTVVGGTLDAGVLEIGLDGSQGTLTVRGGGFLNSSIGLAPTYLGRSGPGQLTISNATWVGGVNSPVYLGFEFGSQGTLTMVGANVNLLSILAVGDGVAATGAVWQTGGTLTTTNSEIDVGVEGAGQMVVSNGTGQSGDVTLGLSGGAHGTLTLAGASVTFLSTFTIGSSSNAAGTMWLTGGQLTGTNAPTYVGRYGIGQMTVSNGTWLANTVYVGSAAGSQGTLTLAGGTTILSVDIDIGPQSGATGTLWMTGGQLIVTNSVILVSEGGVGQMTVSNATCMAASVDVGGAPGAQGTLTLAAGAIAIFGDLSVGVGGTQTLWQTGGQLTVTNGATTIAHLDVGRMTVSNGTWRTRNVIVGNQPGSQGTLTVAGGVSSVYSNVTIGNTNCTASGLVFVTGGELHVTNDDATAVLEVRNGTVIQTGGILDIDRLVITNPCAHFMHLGGTLIIGLETLDPELDADGDGIPNGYESANGLDPLNPADANEDNDGDGMSNLQEFSMGTDPNDAGSYFHITSIIATNKDVLITWSTATMTGNGDSIEYRVLGGTNMTAGITNMLGFVFVFHGTPIKTTNYLDVGGATNRPARFYRIKGTPNIG